MAEIVEGEDRLSKIEEQNHTIEQQIQEIKKEISILSGIVSDLVKLRDTDSRFFTGKIQAGNINPWALQTALDLRSALTSEIEPLRALIVPSANEDEKRFGIYYPTLEALKSAKEGCTADEVSIITKRRRNTESGYLHRLYLAGVLRRVRIGKKIKYVLADKDLPDRGQ